ncbi:MAG: peptidoglycan editing factor PgeF [Clostridia bacterium]|nr:peptidoglycan editing factor PgeF [Clostridia bacterium]
MSDFVLHTNGNLKYYTIDKFDKTGLVKHCFSTRCGGVSSGIYESLNLKLDSDDKRENVLANFKIICDEIDVNYRNLVFSNQVHDDKIYKADKKDIGKGIFRESDILGIDGLICGESRVPIVTFYADCVPLFFLDKENKAIGLSHSGWKGTVKKIAKKTIEAMMNEYGSKSEHILAAIGPSIGKCHFQVGDDVADVFLEVFGLEVLDKRDGKYHVDLKKAILMQFEEMGIPKNNIACADICTYCRSDLLFSHRATGGKRGGLAAIMELI